MLDASVFSELGVTAADLFALGFFVVAWIGYSWFSIRHGRDVPRLHSRMDEFRREWLVRMIERDNRMVDVNILRNLTRSSQFFASTTMVILGALIALTGYVQKALDVVSELPFTVSGSERLVEMKILLMVVIFIYAYFKFTWSIRQFNFSSILVGAAPRPPPDNPEQYAVHINRIARITSYAGVNFNNGLRAYYFALAAVAWFLHPWLMVAASCWVVYVLYHREFRSKTLVAMIENDDSPTLKT